MSFDESEQLRIKQFQKEITEISDRFGITEDAAFPRWICENFLGIEDEGKISDSVSIGGSGDYEVDFFTYIDDNDKQEEQEIIWGQAKFSENLTNTFDDAMLQRLVASIDKFENIPDDANRIFKDRANLFKNLGGMDSRIPKKIVIAVAGTITDQVKSQLEIGSSFRKMYLSNLNNSGKVEIEVIDKAKILEQIVTPTTLLVKMKFNGDVISKKDIVTGKLGIVGYIGGEELIRILKKHGPVLFLENPRRYLGRFKTPNKAMTKTLTDPEKKKKFWKLNNGLTATCNSIVEADYDSNIYEIENLKIVNGQQTSRTILDNEGFVDRDVEVSVRVYETIDDEERNSISKATNTQNPIKPADIVSQFNEQKNLAEQCRMDYQEFWYEQQTASYKNQPEDVRNKITIRRALDKSKTAHRYYAFSINPYQAKISDTSLFSETETLHYDRVFKPNGENRKIKDLIIPHAFFVMLEELQTLWTKQNKEYQDGFRPKHDDPNKIMTRPEFWHKEGFDKNLHRANVLNKTFVKNFLLHWISQSLQTFGDEDRGKIEKNIINELRMMKIHRGKSPIQQNEEFSNEFFEIGLQVYDTFIFDYNSQKEHTWPRDEDGKLRTPSPDDIKKTLETKDFTDILLESKERSIQIFGKDPIVEALKKFLV